MLNLVILIQIADSTHPWQILTWQVAVITGLIAAIIALIQAVTSLIQRKRELRWKQAELARKLLDDIFDFDRSNNALLMIDENSEELTIGNGEVITVDRPDIYSALTEIKETENDKKSKYIRRCFDALFYYLDRVEQSVNIKVVHLDDVKRPPIEYYVSKLAEIEAPVSSYLKLTSYKGASDFLNRFEVWHKAKATSECHLARDNSKSRKKIVPRLWSF